MEGELADAMNKVVAFLEPNERFILEHVIFSDEPASYDFVCETLNIRPSEVMSLERQVKRTIKSLLTGLVETHPQTGFKVSITGNA